MVCSSRDSGVGASGDGANTSSPGYVRLEAECLGVEDDFYAATPDAIARFAAPVDCPSFFAVDSPASALPLMMFAALSQVFFDCLPRFQRSSWARCLCCDVLCRYFFGTVAVTLPVLGSAR